MNSGCISNLWGWRKAVIIHYYKVRSKICFGLEKGSPPIHSTLVIAQPQQNGENWHRVIYDEIVWLGNLGHKIEISLEEEGQSQIYIG